MTKAIVTMVVAAAVAAAGAGAVSPRIEDFTMACRTAEVGGGQHGFRVGSGNAIPAYKKTAYVAVSVSGNLSIVMVDSDRGILVNRSRCNSTRAKVPSTRAGISGSPTTYATGFNCLLEGRIIVRIRAVHADGNDIAAAQVAVRSEATGKPLAFGLFRANGSTALFAAPRCTQS